MSHARGTGTDDHSSKPSRTVFKSTLHSFVVSSLVAIVVVVVGISLDRQNSLAYLREIRVRTENEVSLIRARVSAQISINMTIARDLANLVSMNPSLDSEETERQINWMLIQNPQITSIALAPDYVVRAVFPPLGNDVRTGRDVRLRDGAPPLSPIEWQDHAARFYGPVATSDGGSAFAVLFPVFAREGSGRRLWGAIEMLIDADQFYRSTGLKAARSDENEEKYPQLDHLAIAVRAVPPAPGEASGTRPFLGDTFIFDGDPVLRTISFPGGRWELAAIPRTGWEGTPPNRDSLRVIILMAGCIIIIPVFVSGLLLAERNRNILDVEGREARLRELSQRLGLALEASKIGIWELRDDGAILYWDERAAALHGSTGGEGERYRGRWLDLVYFEDRGMAAGHLAGCSVPGAAQNAQYRIALADGTIRYLRSAGAYYEKVDGVGKTIGIVWDVTADAIVTATLRDAKANADLKNAELELALRQLSSRERQLEELSQKLNLALDSYHCGIWDATVGSDSGMWDERMHELYGVDYIDGEVSEERWLDHIHPDDRIGVRAAVHSYSEPGDTQSLVCRVVQPDGSLRYIRSVGKVHESLTGERKIFGIAFDVTEDALLTAQLKAAKDDAVAKNIELELAKNRIEHNALHDPLTALANRRKLDLALENLTANGRTERQKFSILHIDLDRFKEINDTLGHAAGDAMLVHASRVLAKCVRSSDIVARIGGDEFVIVAMGASEATSMAGLASRIIEEIRQPIDFQGFSCRCGVSIGIAQANGLHVDARKVLINADIALYRAKSTGRNRFEFFNQNLQAEIVNSKRTADAILSGLENGEFTAWYQPQFSARTRQLTGVEALVRWNHPTKGVLAPDQFLRIADELNVVQTLDRIVLETALRDKMRWAARGVIVPKISVNVSARRLHDDSLIATLTDLQVAPGELSFELVESIFLDESEDVVSQNLDRIKALGIDIEIDDFGTGHTSIVSLLKLKPKRLKIDRQLVMPILTSPHELALVRSIVDIARSLGVETVAEGVETLDHAALLSDLGCDLLQGYAFARPLSRDDFATTAMGATWRLAS